jgi:Plasmid pRiA4b ORF-3-like protein
MGSIIGRLSANRLTAQRKSSSVWRLTVRLTGIMPVVWRTLLIRPDMKLSMLHRYLQAAMGWDERHLYAFKIGDKEYGIPNRDLDRKIFDARRYSVARLFPEASGQFEYVYDFGDRWQHTIELQGVEPAEYRKQDPICVDGAEACPPEDVGGPPGYRQFLADLRDSDAPNHATVVAWAEEQFYTGRFRPEQATWRMRDVQRGFV